VVIVVLRRGISGTVTEVLRSYVRFLGCEGCGVRGLVCRGTSVHGLASSVMEYAVPVFFFLGYKAARVRGLGLLFLSVRGISVRWRAELLAVLGWFRGRGVVLGQWY